MWTETPSGAILQNSDSGKASSFGVSRPMRARYPRPSGLMAAPAYWIDRLRDFRFPLSEIAASIYFCRDMNSPSSAAISSALVSSAKCPASNTQTSAHGTSLR
jgi:hypothetical protein